MIWFVEDSEIYLFSVKDDKFYSGIFQKLFSTEKTSESFEFWYGIGSPHIPKYAGHFLTQSKSDLFVFGETEFGEVFFIAVSVLRQIETSVKI